MSAKFDTLTDRQKTVAEMMVNHAIQRKEGSIPDKKLTQREMAEEVDVTVRTIRNWQNDALFLEYVGYLSKMRLQAAMPEFVGVLIANLERGQNVSTKQLDLIAKVADWLPDKEKPTNQLTLNVGHSEDIQQRIAQLEERGKREIIDVTPKEDVKYEEAEYRDAD